MADEPTPGQLRAEYVATMGDSLGPVFWALWNECVSIHWKWADFVVLHGTSNERLDILNHTAAGFFGHLQGRMWDEILLHLSRLTGPPRTAGKWDNLTVRLLPDLVPHEIADEVRTLVDVAIARAQFVESWRNQRIAHTDLQLALNDPAARPLQPASRKRVAEALAAIVALMHRVEDHYGKGSTCFDMPLVVGTAKDLLRVLQDGLETRAARRRQLIEDSI